MSATMSTLRLTVVSKDPDFLPDGVWHDNVLEEVVNVVNSALKAWYDERGKDLVELQPEVG